MEQKESILETLQLMLDDSRFDKLSEEEALLLTKKEDSLTNEELKVIESNTLYLLIRMMMKLYSDNADEDMVDKGKIYYEFIGSDTFVEAPEWMRGAFIFDEEEGILDDFLSDDDVTRLKPETIEKPIELSKTNQHNMRIIGSREKDGQKEVLMSYNYFLTDQQESIVIFMAHLLKRDLMTHAIYVTIDDPSQDFYQLKDKHSDYIIAYYK